MSTGIEFQMLAVLFDGEAVYEHMENVLGPGNYWAPRGEVGCMFVENGSSNTVTRNRQGREVLARHWGLPMIGTRADIMARVCRVSEYVEAEMTRFYGQSSTTPEAYIRRYRKALDNAIHGRQAADMLQGTTITMPAGKDDRTLGENAWAARMAQAGQLTRSEDRVSLHLEGDANDIGAALIVAGLVFNNAGRFPWARMDYRLSGRIEQATRARAAA